MQHGNPPHNPEDYFFQCIKLLTKPFQIPLTLYQAPFQTNITFTVSTKLSLSTPISKFFPYLPCHPSRILCQSPRLAFLSPTSSFIRTADRFHHPSHLRPVTRTLPQYDFQHLFSYFVSPHLVISSSYLVTYMYFPPSLVLITVPLPLCFSFLLFALPLFPTHSLTLLSLVPPHLHILRLSLSPFLSLLGRKRGVHFANYGGLYLTLTTHAKLFHFLSALHNGRPASRGEPSISYCYYLTFVLPAPEWWLRARYGKGRGRRCKGEHVGVMY